MTKVAPFRDLAVAILLIVMGSCVYSTSFSGVFLLDDYTHIVEYERIRSLSWPWTFLQDVRRPFLYLTLAGNFAFGELNPFGYHLFNLTVHVLAAFFLYKLVRLSLPREQEAFWLALCIAVLWCVHPLQTQSVTYMIQRAESLMAMLFLFSLYAAARFFRRPGWPWAVMAGAGSLLSGLTKEVAVVLPLVVLLYDRAFVSRSFRSALKSHARLYALLSVTWIAMFALLATARPEVKPSAGFGYKGIPVWQYALTQPEIILYYLRLVLWPHPLVFDYGWEPVSSWQDYAVPLAVVLATIFVFLRGFRRFPKTGCLGLSFFLILLPSSSVIPLRDLAFEHRMYLPLAVVLTGLVLGVYHFCVCQGVAVQRRVQGLIILSVLISSVWGYLTWERNRAYHSPLLMWQDVITKRPDNPRAYNNYGKYLRDEGRLHESIEYFQKALALQADYGDAYLNLGSVHIDLGQPQQAEALTARALALNSQDGVALNNMGAIYANREEYAQAVSYFQEALKQGFNQPGVYYNLGVAYAKVGKPYEAIANLQACLKRDAQYPQAAEDLQEVLETLRAEKIPEMMAKGVGRTEALQRFEQVVKDLGLDQYVSPLK